jgi:phenylacetic acid degradation operon negative regulatory protein
VSHLAAPAAADRFGQALRLSLEQARRAAWAQGLSSPEPAAAVVGASGIEAGTGVQAEGERLAAVSLGLPAGRVRVTGDERTALRGAFDGEAEPWGGIVVISGTGCIALGRNGSGDEHRCGGWGWLLDRCGSACDIGRDALSLSLEMADGRRPRTPLRAALWQALATAAADAPPEISAQWIKARVVEPGFGAAGFAGLAPAVDALAGEGDPQAQAILDASAAGLAAMVRGVAGALGLERPRVCGLGGALAHLSSFAAAYRQALQAALPGARAVPPRGDGCQGALRLAADLLRNG